MISRHESVKRLSVMYLRFCKTFIKKLELYFWNILVRTRLEPPGNSGRTKLMLQPSCSVKPFLYLLILKCTSKYMCGTDRGQREWQCSKIRNLNLSWVQTSTLKMRVSTDKSLCLAVCNLSCAPVLCPTNKPSHHITFLFLPPWSALVFICISTILSPGQDSRLITRVPNNKNQNQ